MRQTIRTFSLCLFVLATTSVAVAREPEPSSLPVAGSWARYHIVALVDGEELQPSVVEICFLEQAIEAGHPCRWLEFRIGTPSLETPQIRSVVKILVREEDLFSSERPIRNAIRQYERTRIGDRETPQETRNFDSENLHTHFGPLLEALPARRKFSNSVREAAQIDFQRGKLNSVEKLRGKLEGLFADERPQHRLSFVINYELHLHDKVPTGFAAAKLHESDTMHSVDPPKEPVVVADGTIAWTLLDFGTGAKSELPDKK